MPDVQEMCKSKCKICKFKKYAPFVNWVNMTPSALTLKISSIFNTKHDANGIMEARILISAT